MKVRVLVNPERLEFFIDMTKMRSRVSKSLSILFAKLCRNFGSAFTSRNDFCPPMFVIAARWNVRGRFAGKSSTI